MTDPKPTSDKLLWFLRERAKELNCLYRIEEWLNKPGVTLDQVCMGIIESIPPGWQYPDICQSRIILEDSTFTTSGLRETPWAQTVPLKVFDEVIGTISVYYSREMPHEDEGPFLKEETKLLATIAERLSSFITFQKMRTVFTQYRTAAQELVEQARPEWRVVLDLLSRTDRNLYYNISTKMLNYLCWTGVEDAKRLAQYYDPEDAGETDSLLKDSNVPHRKRLLLEGSELISDETFKIAADELSAAEILSFIQRWIQQDKLSFLIKTLANINTPISELNEAVRRYHRMAPEGHDIPVNTKRGLMVSLIRRIFSESLDYINIAKHFVEINDVFDLMHNVIYLSESQGKLGGKAAGIFLAGQILKRAGESNELLAQVQTPRAYYITSDVVLHFMSYNNFEEVIEQKYKEIDQIRLEYPNVVQTFKNAVFPPDIIKALSVVLDDFGEHPLIVRSSSLLEDRTGSAFSGKYKSLFLANQGSKEKRLAALMDAIAEVYASTFGPDPIEYRAERGLLDFHEEMGIIIQEVIGTRIGRYFCPVFAGVAFSRNELRWSPRIKREDGLLRMVVGLGTRAVDRTSDDYPILVSPGQPGLRVNVTVEEAVRYSPKMMDVIDLETNSFVTLPVGEVLSKFGDDIPMIEQIVSLDKGDRLQRPVGINLHLGSEHAVVTFDGLLANTRFMSQIQAILQTLEEKLGNSVDIEFAHDGKNFYLLQCRPQSHSDDSAPAPIPKDLPAEKTIFTANRYVSNGRMPDITHIVYVDPEKYKGLGDRPSLLAVGRAISRLNQLLPKRQFILIGPGRWGSRGDIKLGVSVTYSDINNSAMLIEVARTSGNYQPDLSFGTHFFQDLVEAHIRYLPLYPDDPGIIFNEAFLHRSRNILGEILPEFEYLQDVVKLIDVPRSAAGQVLQVLMNADLDYAVALLCNPRSRFELLQETHAHPEFSGDHHWRWRHSMAEQIAAKLDAGRFGVKGVYLFGSTKNGTAGPSSDIDLLLHVDSTPEQRELLQLWLDGWSRCLAEINYERTGFRNDHLLDVHLVTDEDIANRDSYAIKIGAVTDAAKPLAMGNS